MKRPIALLLLPVALLAACAGNEKHASTPKSYADDAEQAYLAALEQFREDDCLQAEPMFKKIRKDYPFSRFAALSELRIADCLLKDTKYAEAVQAYQQFVRFRPSHEQVPYAKFKVAQAHFEQIPSGWFLSPPAYERDQAPAHEALKSLRRFMLDYPDDPRVPEARDMMKKVIALLAAHELYVARFYLHRDVPKAAIARLRTLLATYEGSDHDPEALLLLGESYLDVHDRDQARQAFESLVERFPKSDEASTARKHLKKLGPGVEPRATKPEPQKGEKAPPPKAADSGKPSGNPPE